MKFLFVSAHPDDLEFSCANLMRSLVQMGHEVQILCLTKGEFGIYDQDWIGPRLARIRVWELKKAAKINQIPINNIYFGDFIDGFLKFSSEQISTVIEWLNKLRPNVVFAPEAYYAYYWQVDHINCGKILYYIYRSGQKRLKTPISGLYFYNTLKPNFWWPSNDIKRGKKAFYQHQSQMWFIKWILLFYSLDKINLWRKKLGSWKYAERYRKIEQNSSRHNQKKKKNTHISFQDLLLERILGNFSKLPPFNPTRKRYYVEQKTSEFAKKVELLSDKFYPEKGK